MKQPLTIELEIDADSAGERVVGEWLRAWRRRGLRPFGKVLYRHQGAVIIRRFSAPAPAIADLRVRMQSCDRQIELRFELTDVPKDP